MTPTNHSERGMSVIELSVVLMLLSIVAVIAFGFVNSTMTTTSRVDANVRAERDGQLALRTIMQDVRAANPIGDLCGGGYGDCLTFDILRPTGGNPNCKSTMTYRLSGGTVLQNRVDTGCAANRTWTDRPIIEVTNATSGTNLFAYTNRLGQPIAPTINCASANPVTAPCPKHAKAVAVNLVISFRTGVAPLRLSSVASVRNNR